MANCLGLTSRPTLRAVTEADPKPTRDLGWLSLVFGLASATWAALTVLPSVGDLQAWPAASLGVVAVAFARFPGRALPRGLGAFLGVVGFVVGCAKILALWGVLELLT